MKLSYAQEQIVTAPIGIPMQVLASAGSGKTRVLTARVRHILEARPADGIVALTFTNKAAEEMLHRLDGVDGLEEKCWIATVHSIAQRILDQYGHTIGLPSDLHIFERDQDRQTVFLESVRALQYDVDEFLGVSETDKAKSRAKIVQNYMEQFSVIKRELLSDEEIETKYGHDEHFFSIYKTYQKALLDSGGIDFDDILVYAHRILIEQSWCGDIYRAKYKHICVDEAQDLNRAQYEFIKSFCGETIKSIMMVGDPNQMIYGFNGSSHSYLCEDFVSEFSAHKYELKQNYRSSKSVIRVANKLRPSSQVESEFALEGLCQFVESLNDEEAEATWIANKIQELLSKSSHEEIEGPITLERMVVIARNKFVFSALEKLLEQRNVPFSLKKGERRSEPESQLGKTLDLAMRVRLNSKDWVDGRKLFSHLKVELPEKYDDPDLLKSLSELVRGSQQELASLKADMLLALAEIDLSEPNVPKLCSDFDFKIKALVSSGDAKISAELERSQREIQDFGKCWTVFRKKGLGESLLAFRNAMALGQLVGDSDDSGVVLSTVHTMKGLEKDIVFLMCMCEGVFPDYRAVSKKEIEEERNSAFVAVTRSRRWLYVTYPKKRMMPWGDTKAQAPSRFIGIMKAR